MASVLYVLCLLLLTAVKATNAQPKKIISIDELKKTLHPMHACWENKTESSSVEGALDGVELYSSTVVVAKHKCKCEELRIQESAANIPHDPPCPTWFFPDPSSNGTCRCGDNIHDTVRCNDSMKEVAILDCYCMTYNESTGPVVGTCFYNCKNSTVNPLLKDELYHLLASDVTELDKYMCGHLNREGQLYGKCKENYSIPVYSYDLKCVKCSTSPFNWVKYILAAFLPLILFFVLVLSCRLSATSPKLLISQTLAIGPNVRVVLAATEPYTTLLQA